MYDISNKNQSKNYAVLTNFLVELQSYMSPLDILTMM